MPLPQLPTIEPTQATAGDTWQWQRAFDDYPIGDGWLLSYGLNGLDVLTWNPSWATNDGATWTITIPKASTGLKAGSYEVTAILTGSAGGTGLSNGQRVTFPRPPLVVLPDPAGQAAGARVSHAARVGVVNFV